VLMVGETAENGRHLQKQYGACRTAGSACQKFGACFLHMTEPAEAGVKFYKKRPSRTGLKLAQTQIRSSAGRLNHDTGWEHGS
jgi:hypothetical protein